MEATCGACVLVEADETAEEAQDGAFESVCCGDCGCDIEEELNKHKKIFFCENFKSVAGPFCMLCLCSKCVSENDTKIGKNIADAQPKKDCGNCILTHTDDKRFGKEGALLDDAQCRHCTTMLADDLSKGCTVYYCTKFKVDDEDIVCGYAACAKCGLEQGGRRRRKAAV